MANNARGRSALIIAAGLVLCMSAPLRAAEAGKSAAPAVKQIGTAGKPILLTRFGRARGKQSAVKIRKPGRVIAKGYRRKAIEANAVPTTDDAATIPAAVANANAQWALPAQAADVTDAAVDIAAADELNDLDRSLNQSADDKPVAGGPTSAGPDVASNAMNSFTAAAPPVPAAVPADGSVMSPSDASASGHSSLIGKIFLAFGGLLTLASAARMFVA